MNTYRLLEDWDLADRTRLVLHVTEAVHQYLEETVGVQMPPTLKVELYDLSLSVLHGRIVRWWEGDLPSLHGILLNRFPDLNVQIWQHIAIFKNKDAVQQDSLGKSCNFRTRIR